jgi:hypothetical protein
MSNENSRELTAPGGEIANPRTFRELLAPGYCDVLYLTVSSVSFQLS